ncbi:DUF3224 domain-containing protein [Rhodococcus sp. WB9]|uniref:DUF3224 domain-containing protein n=1 Tax=Rhodococcus sp. WB9 TaxID=2594007 RepID=UPI00118475A7|nr:DUF3224 domain-containing protein [Rhodococcus sp. WB9]QDQ90025.1 DUF3224 domain-containing protein [Rhodococcus sp. WB9]
MSTRHAASTFDVSDFSPWDGCPSVATGVTPGDIDMVKNFSGDIEGRSVTRFVGSLTEDQSAGAYAAWESFEGSIDGVAGSFAFLHMQVLSDSTVQAMALHIVPSSGTGGLAGPAGADGIRVDEDGTHRLWPDYLLPD